MASTSNEIGSMLTLREVGRLLHVHSNTLRRWSDQGIIKAYRIGPRGDRRFRAEDIAKLLTAQESGIVREEQHRVGEEDEKWAESA